MNKYVRICRSLNDFGKLVKAENWLDSIEDCNKEYYKSVFYYNDEHKEIFKSIGSVRGIRDVVTDQLIFDFDNKENPEIAQSEAKELITRLNKEGISSKDIEVYFSGNKGIHVCLSLNKEITPTQAYHLAINQFGKGLSTLDLSLYDSTQILRVAGTKHPSSNLYKIPITVDELNNLSISEIRQKAMSLENITEEFNWSPVTIPVHLFKIEEQKKLIKVKIKIDWERKPSNWKNCKWSLLEGNFDEGQRHNALMVVAATCRGLGYDKQQAYYLCKSALKKQAALAGKTEFPKDELWKNIIEDSVYTENWEGGQYSCKKDGWLKTYCEGLKEHTCKQEDDVEEYKPQKIDSISNQFKNFVLNIDKNTVKTGLKTIDVKMPLTIGMNLGIVGAPSSGKTALALEILKNTSKSNVTSVFASLDMHRNRLFEKLLYKVSEGQSREEIYSLFNTDSETELVAKIKEDYGNVYFYDRSCPNVQDIREYIKKINNENENKVKLVMLDYFERVNSDVSDDTAASKDVAGQLQDLVNDFNICLITLVQPNKMSLSGGPDTPIMSYTAIKGSSFLYQSFRSILSIWRPFLTPSTMSKDKFMQMAILKNDLGELGTFDYGFAGKTGKIYELEDHEREDLHFLLKEKEDSNKKVSEEWK